MSLRTRACPAWPAPDLPTTPDTGTRKFGYRQWTGTHLGIFRVCMREHFTNIVNTPGLVSGHSPAGSSKWLVRTQSSFSPCSWPTSQPKAEAYRDPRVTTRVWGPHSLLAPGIWAPDTVFKKSQGTERNLKDSIYWMTTIHPKSLLKL